MKNVGSLFSGIGGFELGFRREGFKTKWFTLRTTNIAKQSSERTFQTPLFMGTSGNSILENSKKLIYSRGASHAKTSHVPIQEEKASQENEVGCGHITQKQLGKYDPNTQSLKTSQCSLTEDSMLSLETLPKAGMMRNGSVYELQISERYTEENDCLLLPTPTVSDYQTPQHERTERNPTGGFTLTKKKSGVKYGAKFVDAVFHLTLPTLTNSYGTRYMGNNPTMKGALLPTLTINGNHNYKGASKTSGDGIITVLKRLTLPTLIATEVEKMPTGCMYRLLKFGEKYTPNDHRRISLPTIGMNEYKGSIQNRYKGNKDFRGAKMSEGLRTCKEDSIYLNPSFAEVVMGFPRGWSELSVVGMQSYRKSRSSSQGGLKK